MTAINFNKYQRILSIYFIILVLYWIILKLMGLEEGFWNYFFSFVFSLAPLLAGLYGCFLSKDWGWFKSAVGRGVFFVSLGSFLWGAGSMVWSYYNFFTEVAAPYPSLADIGFILSLPCWIYGIVSMSKATGARVGLKNTIGKVLFIFLPAIIAAVSYYLLVIVARGGVVLTSPNDMLKLILDLAYPIGDVAILTLALLIFGLSANYLGGKYKLAIWSMLLGFAMMYFADFIFSYTTTIDTFYNGDFGDLLFAFALILISIGTLGFRLDQTDTK